MDVRYFFVLLWGYLDDYGRGVDDDLLIASDCFPRDRNITPDIVDGWLELMADSGPICRYEVDGRRYLHCPNWSEHQKPQHPGKPRVPPCPDDEPDPFKVWRDENPQRIRTRSRKSREGLMSVSAGLSGASAKASGDPSEGHDRASSTSAPHLRPVPSPPAKTGRIVAGHSHGITAHESLMNISGDPTETLTPEQGAGSREQGARENNASANVPAIPTPLRPDVEEACALLSTLIEANGSRRPAITQRWRDAARLMLDKDHIPLADVLSAIRWSQADEFWRSNVLSMPKLRDKYDTLRLQAQRRTTNAALAPTGTSGPLTGTDARVNEHLELLQRMRNERNQ
jgi:hypothetical protein